MFSGMTHITIGCPKVRVEIFMIKSHNNKPSRLDACPSATREGKNFNAHFWAAYAPTEISNFRLQ
jgi:hypothetical protein